MANIGKGIILCPTSSVPTNGKTTSDCSVVIYETFDSASGKFVPTSMTNPPVLFNVVSGTPTKDTVLYQNLLCVVVEYAPDGKGGYTFAGIGQLVQEFKRFAVMPDQTVIDQASTSKQLVMPNN